MRKFFSKNKFPLLVFFFFQLGVILVFQLGEVLVTENSEYPHVILEEKDASWLGNRANFDGIHYLGIAKYDYGLYQQVFFPLYPRLMSWLGKYSGGHFILAGVVISWLCFGLGLLILFRLICLEWSKEKAKKALLYLVTFPTAFYFSAVYSEGLFFLLVVLAFYWAKKRNWFLAALAAALASATRATGIFLLPALIVEIWYQLKEKKILVKNFILTSGMLVLVCPLGLLYYMNYLRLKFGDPLLFVHIQANFGAGRIMNKLILIHQVFWRYLKMIFTCDRSTPLYFSVWLEFLTGAIFLCLLIFIFFKMRKSYFIFAFFSFFLPTLNGNFLSLPRFVLTIFPMFIALTLFLEKHPLLEKVYIILAIIFSIACGALFSRGYWIA